MTKVIALKAKPPIRGAEAVDRQISAAHRYYNRLVELTNQFSAARLEAKRRYIPGLVEAEADAETAKEAVAELRRQVKARNAASRSKTASDEDREAIRTATAARNAANLRRRELLALAADNAGYQAELARLIVTYEGVPVEPGNPANSRRTGGLLKEARRTCGVYSGTYLRVEQAIDQARQDSGGRPMRFRRWNGGGLVGPQIQPPLSTDRLGGPDTRFWIELRPTPRGSSQRVLCHIRVESADRDPVWAVVPAVLPAGRFPAGSVLKWVSLIRRQVGVRRYNDPAVPDAPSYRPYYEWSVQLTIDGEEADDRAASGACGINFGYRLMPDRSLRVATAVGDDGHREHLAIPEDRLAGWRRINDLRSERTLAFDAMRDRLVEWLSLRDRPAWLAQAADSLVQWKSQRRLGGLQGLWARNRFEGDEEIFVALTAWRRYDVDTEEQELQVSANLRRWRLAIYRNFAAAVRRRYRVVGMDDTDYQELKRRPAAERNEAINETARFHSGIAAPGLLRQLLVRKGGLELEAFDITRTCHGCRSIESWDQASEVEHTCSSCGIRWDQDVNAATNLLRMVRDASGEVTTPDSGPARGTEVQPSSRVVENPSQSGGKWAKRKANRSQSSSEATVG